MNVVIIAPKGQKTPGSDQIAASLEAIKEYLEGVRAACATVWDACALAEAEAVAAAAAAAAGQEGGPAA